MINGERCFRWVAEGGHVNMPRVMLGTGGYEGLSGRAGRASFSDMARSHMLAVLFFAVLSLLYSAGSHSCSPQDGLPRDRYF